MLNAEAPIPSCIAMAASSPAVAICSTTRCASCFPGSKCITLDLTDLAYVDSMGLGTLVRLHVAAKGAGSSLELINLGKQIREPLGITNLLSLFGNMCEQGVVMESLTPPSILVLSSWTMADRNPYLAITREIAVSVEPTYLEARSRRKDRIISGLTGFL